MVDAAVVAKVIGLITLRIPIYCIDVSVRIPRIIFDVYKEMCHV